MIKDIVIMENMFLMIFKTSLQTSMWRKEKPGEVDLIEELQICLLLTWCGAHSPYVLLLEQHVWQNSFPTHAQSLPFVPSAHECCDPFSTLLPPVLSPIASLNTPLCSQRKNLSLYNAQKTSHPLENNTSWQTFLFKLMNELGGGACIGVRVSFH